MLEIRCPDPKCGAQVNYYDVCFVPLLCLFILLIVCWEVLVFLLIQIQRVVPLDMFSKYEDFTLLAALSQGDLLSLSPSLSFKLPQTPSTSLTLTYSILHTLFLWSFYLFSLFFYVFGFLIIIIICVCRSKLSVVSTSRLWKCGDWRPTISTRCLQ